MMIVLLLKFQIVHNSYNAQKILCSMFCFSVMLFIHIIYLHLCSIKIYIFCNEAFFYNYHNYSSLGLQSSIVLKAHDSMNMSKPGIWNSSWVIQVILLFNYSMS